MYPVASLIHFVAIYCRDVVTGVIALLNGLQQVRGTGLAGTKAKQAVAPLTGVVWSACAALKALPLSNKAVLLSDLARSAATVRDALDELAAAVKASNSAGASGKLLEDDTDVFGDDLDDSTLETEAAQLAERFLLILKPAASLFSGLASDTEAGLLYHLNDEHTGLLETVVSQVRQASAAADDAACSFYAFESRKSAHSASKDFCDIVLQLLHLLRNSPIASVKSALQRLDLIHDLIRKASVDTVSDT